MIHSGFPGGDRRGGVSSALRSVASVLGVVLGCLLGASSQGGQTVYRVIGPGGEVSYTDTPPEQGQVEAIELKDANTQPALEVSGKKAPATPPAANPYSRVEITSPENDATILPDQLSIVVQLELEPPLQGGHSVQFFLDGEPQGVPAAATAIALGDLYRGTRTILAKVLDDAGAVITQSNAVTIHVKRHSIKHPALKANPPRPNPPQK